VSLSAELLSFKWLENFSPPMHHCRPLSDHGYIVPLPPPEFVPTLPFHAKWSLASSSTRQGVAALSLSLSASLVELDSLAVGPGREAHRRTRSLAPSPQRREAGQLPAQQKQHRVVTL